MKAREAESEAYEKDFQDRIAKIRQTIANRKSNDSAQVETTAEGDK